MNIPFTQYMRPNGRPVDIYFECSEDLDEDAQKILDRGLRFEAEVLSTGDVSLTVSDGDEDIAIQLCPNGPEIHEAVKTLIREAAASKRHKAARK